jgi:cell division protein FtsZ
VMPLHPLRHAAPQMVAVAEAMPEAAVMETMATAAPLPVSQPVAAEAVIASRPAPATPRSGLFAEPSGPVSVQPGTESSRPSLFSTVTGRLRRRQHHAPAASAEPAPVRADPVVQETRIEPPRVSMRQTAGEEVGLDIPAFLRRQSS